MRFLLDMGLAPRTAVYLRQQGHDAVHLREQGLQRLPDPQIVKKAVAEGRIIATFDLDFPQLLAVQQLASPSVILFRLDEFATEQLHVRLDEVIQQYGRDLEAGAIVVVDPDRLRIRTLPIW